MATGGRPQTELDGTSGLELALTSDDVFSLPQQPKKVLVVGGGFVGTEIASFLQGLGSQVTMISHIDYVRGKL